MNIKAYLEDLRRFQQLESACDALTRRCDELNASDATSRSVLRLWESERRKTEQKVSALREVKIQKDLFVLEQRLRDPCARADEPSAPMDDDGLLRQIAQAQTRVRELDYSQWLLERAADMMEAERQRLARQRQAMTAEKKALAAKLDTEDRRPAD
jgi:hypothetical protein